jgi:hypothetical protein
MLGKAPARPARPPVEVTMTRLLCACLIAVMAFSGCDRKKPPNNAPTPKTSAAQTDEALRAVAAASPASDPSLPSAATAFAAQDSAQGGTTVR